MAKTFTHHFNTALFNGTVAVNTGLFINGQWLNSLNGDVIVVINPADGETLTEVAAGNAADIDLAVQAAKRAFKTVWGLKTPGHERGRLLCKLADLIEKNHDSIAAIEALDAGKHFNDVRRIDVQNSIYLFRYYAGWADKNHGKTIETSGAKFAYTRHEPIGVVGLISPWNYPLVLACGKLAPALAAGNTVVLKPPEVTPLSALMLAALVKEAGFPDGVVNIVTGYGSTAGQALIAHHDVGKISFTGSTPVGRKIMETSAKTNLKRLTLELGGKNAVIIFDDADLEQALKWTVMGVFGQVCAASSRVFVQEGIYDAFMERFVAAVNSMRLGDGFRADVDQGPVVSQEHLDRVLNYIESGKREGARLVTGGTRAGGSGFFIKPTIFTDVRPEMKIVRDEIFGPVGVVAKFKTEEEAIEFANDTFYGLTGYFFTQDLNRAIRVSNALEVGSVYVNSTLFNAPQVPFGGFKQSGQGKELGEHALETFTQVKAVHINLGVKL
ncbi:hypothetical protein PHLGIDRAFT_128196 [Phlebiopsis gigantea 11061_1 CR5-6]|uniref:Aldehyde dehydrogenase domain-containing protein n=1 Tax=Phlebiopsis gigantea (strain 11061_1 CR5-6) TaxID=745531 RepID=A0A0C3S9Z8_PHLG1|nr:hypothetical protein PHLGIDRAFT_128196 [Phlebiopsis gigantea 11061_1 CR5-6]